MIWCPCGHELDGDAAGVVTVREVHEATVELFVCAGCMADVKEALGLCR